MDFILSVNKGSSSTKLSLFDQELKLVQRYSQFSDIKNKKISLVGHRIVHGGFDYLKPTKLTDSVVKNLNNLVKLAPLHNLTCLDGVKEAKQLFPNAQHIAVFDTAFHAKMPEKASSYAIKAQYNIKRFGFHGIAHESMWRNFKGSGSKLITLQLGGGSSICAIKEGVSIDTSMGFTPLEGLVMLTRCGDIDPSVIEYLSEKLNKPSKEILKIMNFESGILGLSGTKKIETLPLDSLAIEIFCYRIVKYIGSYIAALQGIDALIFSGGIGENGFNIRKKIIDTLSYFGFSIDEEKNQNTQHLLPSESELISLKDSKEIWVIGSDENRLIAEKCLQEMTK
jgi:acetate kinase